MSSAKGKEQRKKTEEEEALVSLFDQMYAIDLKAPSPNPSSKPKGATLPGCDSTCVDLHDAVLLLKGPLLDGSKNTKNSPRKQAKFSDCIARIAQCEQLLTTDNNNVWSRTYIPLSEASIVFVNKLIDDAEKLLHCDLTADQSGWGNNVPEPLRLHGMLGAIPLSDIGEEECFLVRGRTYLEDRKKVNVNYKYCTFFQMYWAHCRVCYFVVQKSGKSRTFIISSKRNPSGGPGSRWG